MNRSTKRALKAAEEHARKTRAQRPRVPSVRAAPPTKKAAKKAAKKTKRPSKKRAAGKATSRDRELRSIMQRRGVANFASELKFGEEFARDLLEDAIVKDETALWAVANRRGMDFSPVKGRDDRVVADVDEDED